MSAAVSAPPVLADAPLVSQWLRFHREGRLEILSGRVELGQGNLSALLQIVADELDLDPATVTIRGGDTRATPNEGVTAGSLSMTHGGVALRLAASAARHVLLAKAATLLQDDAAALAIADGHVQRAGLDADLTVWDLAAETDLAVPVADHAGPKPPQARRLAGTSMPRVDIAARIATPYFIHDLAPEGLLHGRPVHPPSLGARLEALDVEALAARPGIVQVVRDGSFVGIVADSEVAAQKAARWAHAHAGWSAEPAPPSDPVAAIAQSEAPAETMHEAGEDPADLAGTAIETTVSRPYLSHASIGPCCALALWQDGRLTVWSHTQGPFLLRGALASVFDLSAEDVDVVHAPGAGCYGHNGADDVALDAALMARAVPGRPVRVLWSRADEFGCGPLGPAMVTTARAVVDGEGRLAAMALAVNSPPHVSRPGLGGTPNLRAAAYMDRPKPPAPGRDSPISAGGAAARNAVPPYAIPNLRVTRRLVDDLPYRTSALRALGATLNVFAIETLMDDVAAETGADPVAFRLAHLTDPRARAVVEAAHEAAGPGFADEAGEGAGWGLAYSRYKNVAAHCAVALRVEALDTVRVTEAHIAIDPGEAINPDGIANQCEGGLIQALSWGLKEEVRFDGSAVATANFLDYPILTFSEVPSISVRVLAHPDAPPLGCAEVVQGPAVAALGNAVFRALGVRVRALPLTRERIAAALA